MSHHFIPLRKLLVNGKNEKDTFTHQRLNYYHKVL